jgi:hypothetical protein
MRFLSGRWRRNEMDILIKRGPGGGSWLDMGTGKSLGPDYSRLFIFVSIPDLDIAHGFELNFEKIRSLLPEEEIRG